ncbi:hypothetical protein B296_00041718, partial [Ensete ventricosum]
RGPYGDHTRRRQPNPCPQIQTALEEGSQLQNSPGMASSCAKPHLIIYLFVGCLLLASPARAAVSPSAAVNSTTLPVKHSRISAHLKRVNKPAVKTIEASSISPDGDLIDCVPSHLQPAFDHPKLRGLKPWVCDIFRIEAVTDQVLRRWFDAISTVVGRLQDPPERPKGYSLSSIVDASFQAWTISGESCPEGTVPIRRTTREDILRASSVQRFGRKPAARRLRRDSTSTGHESDAYQETGCYNLLCSGFVQTNNKIAIGAAISPTSALNGGQFDIDLLVWKLQIVVVTRKRVFFCLIVCGNEHHDQDPKHGHWWLELGSGLLVGYWPSFLFSHLAEHAKMVQFGGEIVNTQASGFHTSTQMGSGHFAGEGFRKASYFRNLQLVDWDNSLIPLANLRLLADHPNCYSIQGGVNAVWGNYFYYGGPGRNVRCP